MLAAHVPWISKAYMMLMAFCLGRESQNSADVPISQVSVPKPHGTLRVQMSYYGERQ